jgi:hypothetical protein
VKASQLREFVEAFLEEQGAKFLRRENHILHVEIPKNVPLKWPSRNLVLAFTQRAHQKEAEAEYLTIGHPLLERILELCGEAGRYSAKYEPLPQKKGRRPAVSSVAGLPDLEEGWTWGEIVEAYRPLVYLAFVIRVSTMDAPDDMETLLLDPWTGDFLGDGSAEVKSWDDGSPDPESDRTALPVPDAEGVVKWGLSLVDQKLRKRVQKLKGRHQKDLDAEIVSIENYYRQLIDEVRSGSRRTQLTSQEREEKVRLLQLDWKRRIQEATEYLRPHITVHLSALGLLYRPCWAIQATAAATRGRKKKATARHWMVVDHGSTRWRPAVCASCRKVIKGDVNPAATGFQCESCTGKPESASVSAQ